MPDDLTHLLTPSTRSHRQPALRAVSARIEDLGGINLAQGKCPLPIDPRVHACLKEAAESPLHTATLRHGDPRLRAVIASRFSAATGLPTSPDKVAVSGGATGALECICQAFLGPGDEVVLFKPAFPYYTRMVVGQGATPVFVDFEPDGSLSAERLAGAFSDRTKLVIFCTPQNPTGKVMTTESLDRIAAACRRHDVVAVSDEVYRHFCRPGHPHVSIVTRPGMAERTLVVRSVSKTLLATGWRIGWVIGPAAIVDPISVKSDQLFLCAGAPLQRATALCFERLPPSYYDELAAPFHRRMDRLADGLAQAGLEPLPSEGGYFQLARYEGLGLRDDDHATEVLIETCNIGAVPGSSFNPDGADTGYLRFSCAVPDAMIEQACAQLGRLRDR